MSVRVNLFLTSIYHLLHTQALVLDVLSDGFSGASEVALYSYSPPITPFTTVVYLVNLQLRV